VPIEKTSPVSDPSEPDSPRLGAVPGHSVGPSDEEIEKAIIAAVLDGRGAVAELLAERLKERKHARAGVVTLAKRQAGG